MSKTMTDEAIVDGRHGRVAETFRKRLGALLAQADIRINGSRPWDIQVHNPEFYARVLSQGSLGLGEAYMDGWWDCEALDEAVTRAWRTGLVKNLRVWRELPFLLGAMLFNAQRGRRSYQVGEQHYDVGNDLYRRMLDKRMIYSCGYWRRAQDLDAAQEAKLDLVCRKLMLKPGMRVLDIGCGWGGAAKFAAERYGVEVVGVTISREQLKLAQASCAGLPVEFRLQDYRELNEPFDRIFSIGMFEHVGYKNYPVFFDVVRRCLKEGGLAVLHTIGSLRSVRVTNPWIAKYIFPNSMLPSASQIAAASQDKLVLEDWHNFGADYDRTLMAWYKNFEASWDEIKHNYDERFRRMWRFYLLTCAGGFRARHIQLWQLVFSRDGLPEGYLAEGIR